MVADIADRVVVMYAGRTIEESSVDNLFASPSHPYTRGLLASIPGGAPGSKLQAIQGTVPPVGRLPPGCSFAPRCPRQFDPCLIAPPGVTMIAAVSDGRHPMGDMTAQQRIGHRASDIGDESAHTARCYLYSPAIDPETLPEAKC